MPEDLLQAPPSANAKARPADVPEKFWDAEAGALRVDALLKSYRELERRLSQRAAPPAADAAPDDLLRFRQAMGIPDTPCAYSINEPHELCRADEEVNKRLHAAHFSNAQAQLVYDLAAERLLPVIEEALGELDAQQQAERLQRHFGGVDTWRHTARQIKSWATANLPPDIHATLAGSYEGVLALHQMMRASEPELLGAGESSAAELTEEALAEMMRDPRYWRQRDPEFIARVTAGFKRLYAG